MADRDEKGKFLPGWRGGPGRPRREVEENLLAALREAFSPQEVAQGLRDAYDIAKSQGSARGMVMALMPVIEYAVGKPLQRTEKGETNAIDEALRRMAEMEEQTEQKEIEAMLHQG